MGNAILICFLNLFISMPALSCTASAETNKFSSGLAKHGNIQPVRTMSTGRAAHTATLMNDGRVLIAGGMGDGWGSLDAAEIYDGSTRSFVPTGLLNAKRSSHTATLLPDGRVLIAGGYNGSYLDSTEIFDPKTGLFTPAERMTMPRSGHTATRLSDGRILLAGGTGIGWSFLASAEIYDPSTGKFTAVSDMTTSRESHTATLLRDGKVLITGGHKDRRAAIQIFASTELYDPARGMFEPGPEMTLRRHKHDAVLLNDGNVLIIGGADGNDRHGAYSSTELFNAKEKRFERSGDLAEARYKLLGAAVTMFDGKVFVAGGSSRAEIFDPAKGRSEPVGGTFGSQRLFSTATLLKNGSVLIVGGYDENNKTSKSAWIYPEQETRRANTIE